MVALLLVVDAFPVRGGGVEVLPAVASDRLPPSPFRVTLRAPDGSKLTARGRAILSHVRGSMPPLAMVRLEGVCVEQVPRGTEVWVEEHAAPATG